MLVGRRTAAYELAARMDCPAGFRRSSGGDPCAGSATSARSACRLEAIEVHCSGWVAGLGGSSPAASPAALLKLDGRPSPHEGSLGGMRDGCARREMLRVTEKRCGGGKGAGGVRQCGEVGRERG